MEVSKIEAKLLLKALSCAIGESWCFNENDEDLVKYRGLIEKLRLVRGKKD